MDYYTKLPIRWCIYLVGMLAGARCYAGFGTGHTGSQSMQPCHVVVLDFGCPKSSHIATQIHSLGAQVTLAPHSISDEQLHQLAPDGVILSGGPRSVTQKGSPRAPQAVYERNCPILGVCYGMQTMVEQLGGTVVTSDHEEGAMPLTITGTSPLFSELDSNTCKVWMKHSDEVTKLPQGFTTIASTHKTPIAAMADESRNWYGVQFHPEVSPHPYGIQIFCNFLSICAQNQWAKANH